MADDDWDEEELLTVTGRTTKAGKKRSRKAEESDDDEPERARKAAGGKRRPAAADDDSEDEDDDLDPEEKRKLAGMNELEREMYLFEKEEKALREQERKEVLGQARRDEQVEVRASSRRPRAQTGTDSAIGKIAAAHAQREAREKKKQQEEEQKQGRQRARPSKKQLLQQQEEEEEEEEEEAEVSAGDDEEMQEADEEDELAALDADDDDDDELLGGDRSQQLLRAEAYDEGAGYEESEERASLEEVRSIQLKRSDLEAWHNEPFFEDDVRGCVLRLSVPPTPEQVRAGQSQQTYLLVKVVDVVARNSYAFGKPGARTRKWLHLDDLSGNPVFRYQMSMVSNQEVQEPEYLKASERARRNNGRFITKGDIQLARQHLQHATTFKYNPELVRQMLEKKRATGRMTGSSAQVRARLRHEVNLARQENKPEEVVQRLQDELDRLEQQEQRKQQEVEDLMAAAAKDKDGASAVAASSQAGGKLSTDMALALINIRNRDKNNYKVLGPAAGKKAAGADGGSTADVFSRRHTQSRVYWATSKQKGAADAGAEQQDGAASGGQLLRQASGAADVTQLASSLRKLEPSELIKVLDVSVDLSRLPLNEPGALLSKRLLGLRWFQSVERRQQEMAGRSLLTLDDWKRKMSYQQMM